MFLTFHFLNTVASGTLKIATNFEYYLLLLETVSSHNTWLYFVFYSRWMLLSWDSFASCAFTFTFLASTQLERKILWNGHLDFCIFEVGEKKNKDVFWKDSSLNQTVFFHFLFFFLLLFWVCTCVSLHLFGVGLIFVWEKSSIGKSWL